MKKKLSLLMVALVAIAAFAVQVARRAAVDLQPVSAETTWDFSKLVANDQSSLYANSGIQLKDDSDPTKNDEVAYSTHVTNGLLTADASFNAAALSFKGEYPIRKNQYCQNGVLRFTAGVAGKIVVSFSDTGSTPSATAVKRYLVVNGVQTEYWSSRQNNSENPEVAYDANLNVTSGEIEVPAGDVTITGSSAIQVSKIVFTPAAGDGPIATIAALTALEDKATFTYSGKATIVAMPKKSSQQYVYVQDETGSTLIYDKDGSKTADLAVGKQITAPWTGAVSIYNGLFEIVPDAALAVTADEAVTPTIPEVAITDITAENVNKVVKLANVTIVGVNGNDFVIKNGELSVAGYDQFGVKGADFANGMICSEMVGVIGIYKDAIQFQPLSYTVGTAAPEAADVEISPAAGTDIYAALSDVAVAPFKNITINLAAGNYTISKSIPAAANVIINGAAGAKIDASALSGAFINYASVIGEKAKKDETTESDYTILENITIKDVEITALPKSIINSAAGKVLFKNILVSNAVIKMTGNVNVFALGGGYPENLKMEKSTIWSDGVHKSFFFKADGKPADVTSTSTTTWTVDQSTLYNIAIGKKANNSNGGIKGKATTSMILTNSILYNFGSNTGNEINGWLWGQNGGAQSTYANNAYQDANGIVAGWTDAGKGGSDQTGTSINGKIAFTDAENGNFNGTCKLLPLDATAPEGKVGDPRWTINYTQANVTLWSSETAVEANWGNNISIDKEKFANAKVGDIVHVAVEGIAAGGSLWSAQVVLKAGNYSDIEGGMPVGDGSVTDATFVLTGDMLQYIKTYGMFVAGAGFSSKLVTLESVDEAAGSENSIWVGNATTSVTVHVNHFKCANVFSGVKAGDIIRITSTGEPEWIILQYSGADTNWEWTLYDGAVFTKTETGYDVVVTEGMVAQMNIDGIIINHAEGLTISQVELIPAPVDITVAPTDGDIYTALMAEAAKVAKVGNITINLAADGAYSISKSIVASGNVTINGAAGAKIDASALEAPFIKMSEISADAPLNEKGAYVIDGITIKDVTITGLPYQLIYGNKQKYLMSKILVENSVIGINGTAKKTIFDFNGGGNASEIIVNNSTLWANPSNEQNGGLFSSQSGHGSIQDLGSDKQLFAITNSTIYNIAYGKTTNSQRRNNTAGMEFKVENSIIVNSGKNGQFIVGLNGGSANSAQTYTVNGNVFNFGDADVSAAEEAKVKEKIAEFTMTSINGVVAFTDAANGDFNATLGIELAPTTEKTEVGDPRWTVTNVQVSSDIEISPADGDIAAALATASEGRIVKNIIINLTENVTYTVGATLVAPSSITINGNGATIDASALDANLIEFAAKDAEDTEWTNADVAITAVTVKGLKKALFYSAGKYYYGNFTLINSFIEQAADATTFDYTKGSTALNFTIAGSTIYAPTATTKSLYSSQGGQKATEYNAEATQNFIISLNTMYNLAPTKNFFSHRQNSQKWISYTVQNNLFVNCGKSGQVIKGLNGGGSSANPTWVVKGNAFNFDGADTSANEETGDAEEPVQESVAGVMTFTNVETPDFGGTFEMPFGATAPEALGDNRWTITFTNAATGIQTVKAEDLENATIYTIAGQRVEKAQKGLYIINGKKVMIK